MDVSEVLTAELKYVDEGAGDAALARHVLDTERNLQRAARRERKFFLLKSFAFFSVLGIMPAVVIASAEPNLLWSTPIISIGIPALLLLTVKPNGRAHDLLNKIRTMTQFAHGPTAITVRLHPDGIWYETASHTVLNRWRVFEKVVHLPDHLAIVHVAGYTGMVIPRTAFKDQQHIDLWTVEVERYLDAAGHSEAKRVAAYIEREPINCKDCGHDLRGLRNPRCPECGRRITLLTLWSWHILNRKPAAPFPE